MEPLVTLVAVTGLLLLAGATHVPWAARLRGPVVALRGGLAAMFTLTAGAHFVGMRDELIAMVPPALPAPGLLVTLTGIAELGCALALLWSRTARASAAVLTAMLIGMFPANVYAAGGDVPWWDELGPRTATQLVFLAATVTVLVRHRHRHRPRRTVAATAAEPPAGTAPPAPGRNTP
ncbi:hypothetical protein [Streptomyces sp. NPDC008121]|uniref:DoxX family protein n=1 Tax=Streptomyces sp. NPDC008121 TaxID=3364809 RepID=UPI0036E63B7E